MPFCIAKGLPYTLYPSCKFCVHTCVHRVAVCLSCLFYRWPIRICSTDVRPSYLLYFGLLEIIARRYAYCTYCTLGLYEYVIPMCACRTYCTSAYLKLLHGGMPTVPIVPCVYEKIPQATIGIATEGHPEVTTETAAGVVARLVWKLRWKVVVEGCDGSCKLRLP